MTLKYQDKIKGVDLKCTKKKSNGIPKYFRNALTVVMFVDNKFMNFKLSHNGKFQITGAKCIENAIHCVQIFWDIIKGWDNVYNFSNGDTDFGVVFVTVMTNIDFNVGFKIDRSKLDMFINSNTQYNSLLEMSFGYTGVNIKFPIRNNINHNLPRFIYKDGSWIEDCVTYVDYIASRPQLERNKENNKKRFNTFLVFHSGNVIMSGIMKEHMRYHYNIFMGILLNNREELEEKLIEGKPLNT